MWPIQFAFRLRISCRIFLYSLTLSNTSSFLTWSIRLIFSILLQHLSVVCYTEYYGRKIRILWDVMFCRWTSNSHVSNDRIVIIWPYLTLKMKALYDLQNVGEYSPNDTASHPRRPETSRAPLWGSKI
jgi:hypothetical protein